VTARQRPRSTHIVIRQDDDCPFTVNFYEDEEYTGEAYGALTFAEAMLISDMWAADGFIDWSRVYAWL
jgi:hypothetical protein